jgi:hypothetical protein
MKVDWKGGPKHNLSNKIRVLAVQLSLGNATPLHSGIAYACGQRQAAESRQTAELAGLVTCPAQPTVTPTHHLQACCCLFDTAPGVIHREIPCLGHAGTSSQKSSIVNYGLILLIPN